jgi:FkbM family methyltransferase
MNEPTPAMFERAARWHQWAPRWLPGRIAARVRRLVLKRYAGAVVCRLPTGQRFAADPADLLQCLVVTTGGWEQLIFDAVQPLVDPGSTVLDIGAHVGYAALRFADWVGASGRVVCFEPVPGHVAQLERNLQLNDFTSRATVVAMAVSDEAAVREFYEDKGSNSGMGSLDAYGRTAATRHVRTIAVDDWLSGNGVSDLALTKVDVEGAEALVIRGMARSLGDARHRSVLIELHDGIVPGIGREVAAMFDALAGRPYRLYDWQSDRFVEVRHNEPANYLLAVRGDSAHLVAAS